MWGFPRHITDSSGFPLYITDSFLNQHYPAEMPSGLKRYHESQQTHFITFTCYRRLRHLQNQISCARSILSLEQTRMRFGIRVFAFVLMPDHVHLLVSEPESRTLSRALQSFKISSSKATSQTRMHQGRSGPLWQRRYYDRNVRSHEEFLEAMHYIHWNPVTRGLCDNPEQWLWSSFNHYASGEDVGIEIESERTARARENPT